MEISAFLEIGIIGAFLSVVLEYARTKVKDTYYMKPIAIGASLVVGTAYWFLSGTVYYQAVLGVLASASTVYAVFLKDR